MLSAVLMILANTAVAGSIKMHPVLKLHPLQIPLGMIRVAARTDHILSLSSKEREKYLESRPIPLIKGPEGKLYIGGDHHHLTRSIWEAGREEAHTHEKADYSDLSPAKFQEKLIKLKLVYLMDQFGNGPHSFEDLPVDVRWMPDDPLRSVAWKVEKQGGYDKVDPEKFPDQEFFWGNFFRKELTIKAINDNFDKAVKEAMELAKSPKAKDLPGWKGDSKSASDAKKR